MLSIRFSILKTIREQDPLKQGLKQISDIVEIHNRGDSRARSTKTRIETKTGSVIQQSKIIREQDPLKQGLKLEGTAFPIGVIKFASKIH